MTEPHREENPPPGPYPGGRYPWEEIPPGAPQAIVDALGGPDAYRTRDARDPVRVVCSGEPADWHDRGQLVLEDGTPLGITDSLPPDLPPGYHDFYFDRGAGQMRLIVAPRKCALGDGRRWGWAVQLYSTRSRQSWGIGDLADLRRVAQWSAGLGAGLLLVNPLGAAAPTLPQNPSPYYPSSRRFRNPLYLRIEEVPGAECLGTELDRLAATGRGLGADRRLDRDRVFRLKDEALRAIWAGGDCPDFRGHRAQHGRENGTVPFGTPACGSQDPDFHAFRLQQGKDLRQFAAYCVLAEQFGEDWRRWPAEYRRPDADAVRTLAEQNPADVTYHEWLQWLLDRQLARAARELSIVQDLPIGFHPGGADAWIWQDLLAEGVSIGAPPDAFNVEGQNWALPPLVPARLRAAAYEPFIQTIRFAMCRAGGLRIDHVMGLFRLWWIPEGRHASEGVYVRYPADDLLGIVALESHRAGAIVIGEDLGTVEPGVRERLADRRVLSVRLLWFEEKPPAEYPLLSLAAVTTHDLPTIAGLWTGADAAAQKAIGMPVNEEMPKLRKRLLETLGVAEDAALEDVIENAYAALGGAGSMLVTATLEDAQAVPERPNMPGTTDQWPNWSVALPENIETMEAAELPRRIARALGSGRGAAQG
ncbi:MAG: 4-alpha-glucanotransferase [Thermoguttaceae bacterium]|jgi:4-alpha-glucanotransferase